MGLEQPWWTWKQKLVGLEQPWWTWKRDLVGWYLLT